MRSLSKLIRNLIICVLTVGMLLPVRTYAAEAIDTQAAPSLTVRFLYKEEPAPDVEFRLYKVADVSATVEFTVTDTFAGYSLDLSDPTQESWEELISILPGKIVENNIQPDYEAVTDAEGNAVFTDLPVGLYMVMGDVYHAYREYVTPASFLVDLPKRVMTEVSDTWEYDVVAMCKPDYVVSDAEPVEIEVQKVWDDYDYSGRPTEITVQLYDGTTLYDTQVLSKAGNWKYKWTGLYGGTTWTVVEKDVPEGYNQPVVSEVKNGDAKTVFITNSRPSPSPTPSPTPTPTPPPSSGPTPTPAPTPTPTPPPKLPQTGVLWWPVPVLLGAGVVLILFGMLRRKGTDDEE